MNQPEQPRPLSPPEVNPGKENQNPPPPVEKPPSPVPGPGEVPAPKEIGGVKGPEPTRYGDWEHKGRCTDF